MSSPPIRVFAVFAALACVAIVPAPARADDLWRPPPHVRPETPGARDLVADAIARSPLVREMVDRLEQSDVIVYIRHRVFRDTILDGRIGVLTATAGWRFLVIELACGRILTEQMATLGHELHHALEIADAPSIIDTRSLAAYYTQIGVSTGGEAGVQTFETAGAREAGQQVRRDVFGKAVRTAEK